MFPIPSWWVSLSEWWSWIAGVLLSLLALFGLGGCSALMSEESSKALDQTLATLNKHGVVYSGTLEGPTEARAEAYQGVKTGTGGWFSLRLQSPVANPMAGQGATPAHPEPAPADAAPGPGAGGGA